MPPTPVVLAPARATPIEDASEYVASLKSLRSTTVQPQIDGQITKILVAAGDRVAAGRAADADRCAAAAGGGVEPAGRARGGARPPSATRGSSSSGTTSSTPRARSARQQLEQTDTAQRTAEANLKALQAQVQQQEVQLRFFTITAPTAGIVGDVPVRVGNQVTHADRC